VHEKYLDGMEQGGKARSVWRRILESE